MATIYKLPSGKTRVVIRKRGTYRAASFEKATDAKRWATATEAAIDANHLGIKKRVQHAQLGDLIDKYSEETPERGPTTMQQRQYWHDHFGGQKLAHINKDFGRKITKHYADNGAQPPHRLKMLRGIARIIKWGRTVGNLDISEAPLIAVADDIKHSGFAIRYEPRKTIMGEDELLLFVDHFKRHGRKGNFDELLIFLAASGMRIGEATRIVGADVSLNRKSIIIRDRKHPRKKMGNHQEVPLIDEAWDMVKQKVEAGERGLLFPITNPSVRFRNVARRIGLPHCRLHDIRRLPKTDRRIAVMWTTEEVLPFEMGAAMQSFIDDGQSLANLWHWLQDREVTRNMRMPPVTTAKNFMYEETRGDNDAAIDFVLDHCGDLITERQLTHAAYDHLKAEYGLQTKEDLPPIGLKRDVRHRLKNMQHISSIPEQCRQRWASGKLERFRIVRNEDKWFDTILDGKDSVGHRREAKQSERMLLPQLV